MCFTERSSLGPERFGAKVFPMSQVVSNAVPGRPGIALVSFSQLATLCETVAPRYGDQARFFSVRAGYGAAVAALALFALIGTLRASVSTAARARVTVGG